MVIERLKNLIRPSRLHEQAIEINKTKRLEKAEAEVRALSRRSENAVRFLVERDARNHWRESIENMIRGTQ